MPIRMVEDDNNDTYSPNTGGGGGGNSGGGGSGCLLMLAPLVFKMFRSYPKATIAVVIIGVAFYFLGGLGGGTGSEDNSALKRGCDMKREVFDSANVFAALSPEKNAMPARVSLLQYAPKRLNQGEQGSCVAWSSVYSARTIVQAVATGQDPNQIAFSPSFIYNQVHLADCQGAYINRAMDVMQKQGAVGVKQFPYNASDCDRQPSQTLKQDASQFRIRGYSRLTQSDSDYGIDINAIRQHLAKNAPVVIGMMVGGSFMQNMFGRDMWHPTVRDRNQSGFGGHAMCVIGYDDAKEGGAFQLMNSWGDDWGSNGVAWVRYDDFKGFVKEAYGMNPLPKANSADATKFAVSVGLVTNSGSQYIPMKSMGKNVFSSASIRKGTKFKMEVSNSIECYTYIFGQEADGSSYVLFPYTPKHSAFCGITGTRLFPKDHSMQADQTGSKDYMAVVVTKKELDFKAFNESINKSKQGSYAAKVNEALGQEQVQNVSFQAADLVKFQCEVKDKNAVAIIMEINKQ